MMTLILVVCLSATPNVCKEERPIVEAMSPMGCMVQGQQIAAEWVEEHPKWQLSEFRCQAGQRDKAA
jgi:hypothetical protein